MGSHTDLQEGFLERLPIVSIVVPFFWFNQFYILDPTILQGNPQQQELQR